MPFLNMRLAMNAVRELTRWAPFPTEAQTASPVGFDVD